MEDISSLLSGYDYRFKPKGKSSPMVMIRSKPSKSTIHGGDISDYRDPPDNNTLDDLLFHDFVSNVPPKVDGVSDTINGDDDDLIPGFGGTCDAKKEEETNSRATSGIGPLRKPSVPSTHSTSSLIEEDAFIVLEADSFTADDSSRATSKTSPIQKSSVPSTRSTSSLIEEDPFIVLESDSVPADEPSELFTELLEQRGKPNPSRNKDVGISSVQGDGLFDLDPIVGITKAKQREKNRSSSEISPHGAHVPVIKKTTGDPFIVFSEDDLDDLRVDKFPESHRTPVNDSDVFQNALESFFDSAGQWSNSPGPDTSSRDPTYIDDDHLTSMFEGIPSFGISQQIGVESGKRQKAEDIHQRRADPTYIDDDYLTSMFEGIPSFGISQQIGVEIGERQKAEDIHQRRADKALAEKKERDQKMQWELAERQRIAESLDAILKGWSEGKEGNLRALLSTLQDVLWEDSGWEPVSLADLIASASVKKIYRKATLCLHPDKVQQKGANIQQKYIAEKVFDLLKEAWIKLNKEELS